jgi:hypothetical protein
MISIHDYILKELDHNTQYLELISHNLLNLSEYARILKPKIEAQTMMQVSTGSIVTSLSRIKKSLQTDTVIERFYIDDIQIKYPISDIVFLPDNQVFDKVSRLHGECESLTNNFLNVCIGSSEVNIFVNSKYKDVVLKYFSTQKMVFEMSNLCAITIKFDPKYIHIPGITHKVLRELAFRNINLVEVMSTYTEITLFIDQKYSQDVLELLQNQFMHKPDNK